jgi:dTDP-4-amino-4,6-dideoxygalactose transaminase
MGDGGIVVTDKPNLAERARLIRQYGWKNRNFSSTKGMNSRLDELQAAILRVKLQYLDEDNMRRRRIAEIYNKRLVPSEDLVLPIDSSDSVYHQYVIRSPKRDKIKKYLKENGIETAILYPCPIHTQPAYVVRLGKTRLPVTEKVVQEILSLPMHPYLTDHDVVKISELVNNIVKG